MTHRRRDAVIQILEKSKCCGCGACMNACPKNCISMISDNEGFLYPHIKIDLCVKCGICENVCPVVNVHSDEPFPQTAYVVQHKNKTVRKESTAGGAFTAIASWVIREGGVVFGASFDNTFMVEHTSANTVEGLAKFRNSKYVQSDTKNTFREAKELLKQGKWVCYSGTPCQVEGLKTYLGNEYEKLITVDVVCHGIPSPLAWKKYLEMQKEQLGEFSHVMFRDKHYGYKYSTMSFFDLSGKKIYAYGIDTDQMTRAFFSDICDRPSCYDCVFKKRYRVSDFTIWDCYSIFQFDKKMDDDMGTTRVLIHSEKGRQLFEKIKDTITWSEVTADELTAGVREMIKSVGTNPRRKEFFVDANSMSGSELFEKYFPETMKVRLARFLRVGMCKIGMYAFMKRLITRLKSIKVEK